VTGRGERDDAERDARERKTGSFVRYVVAKMRGEVSSRYEFRERELRIAHLERRTCRAVRRFRADAATATAPESEPAQQLHARDASKRCQGLQP
jgi:hypothetical protein